MTSPTTVLTAVAAAAELAATGIGSNPLIAWLISEGFATGDLEAAVAGLGRAINAAGPPVYRMRVSLRTLHPQFIGIALTWRRATDTIEIFRPPHAILLEDRYTLSPLAAIYEGAGAIRRRLDSGDSPHDFPILDELRSEGATDYVAMPLIFSDGRISALTLASDRPGGFRSAELGLIYEALPAIAHAFEVHALRMTAETILETFLGRASGERVLKGLIRRGDAEDIHAVLWYSDLRGSTGFADRLPRPVYLKLLNDYFDCTAGAVLAHGGQILSFIGDAVFAIFPIGDAARRLEDSPEHSRAGEAALAAATEALTRLAGLNANRRQLGQPPLTFGVALHLGDVTYGNIGVEERLDFTVIGPAANEVARLAALCKALERPIVVSAALARLVPTARFLSLGVHAFRGVREPQEVLTPVGA
jgi:adenylate cyclase